MLLALSSFTVRSNLISLLRQRPQYCHGIYQQPPNDPSTEIACETIERETIDQTPPECSVRMGESIAHDQQQLTVKEAELAKWKAAEVFKVYLRARSPRQPIPCST